MSDDPHGFPLLTLDAGNTRVKWGVHDGRTFLATGAVATHDVDSIERLSFGNRKPRAAIASNVAGPRVREALEKACARMAIPLQVIASQAAQLGVHNAYREPQQLGSDRWAALIAAHAHGAADQLVVNVGTALTVDALTREGRFLGGLIAPGPALMRHSLDRGTAGLRLTEGEYHDLPRSTPDAITTGALQACAGAVARMAAVMGEHGHTPARVLLSGGAAAEVAPHLPIEAAIRENLVLEGLVLIARAP